MVKSVKSTFDGNLNGVFVPKVIRVIIIIIHHIHNHNMIVTSGVLPGLYMGYYGNGVTGAHPTHPLAAHPHMMPPTSIFGGHHPAAVHQPPFLPPATLGDTFM